MQRILGQEKAVETLLTAWSSGRLHHAWIFSGPRGVGKFTTAVELARLLLDPSSRPGAATEAGAAGRASFLIDKGTHPDLHVIYKELALYSDDAELRRKKLTNIPIDVLRERMIGGHTRGGKYHEPVAFKTPVLGQGKVFIIDEAELLEDAAQNLLLKTLEEPPPRTYIFLITTQPQHLLPTIHSRCQHARFGPLDDPAMRSWLDRAGLDLDATRAAWVLRFAGGSPGAAQLAAGYGLHTWQATLAPLLEQAASGVYAPQLGETMSGLIEEFASTWVKRHPSASKDAANLDGLRHLLSVLGAWARRRLEERLDRGEPADDVLETVDLVRAAERQIESNVNLKLVLENLAAQMVARRAAAAV